MRKLPQKAQGKDRVLCPYIFRSENMTIQDVINRITTQRNEKNSTNDFIIAKINEIEWKIKREIVDVHEGADRFPFDGYDNKELKVKLIAPEPYSELYIKWVLYQIDLGNNAMKDAANSLGLFNKDYNDFSGWYTRNNKPVFRGNMKSGVFHV